MPLHYLAEHLARIKSIAISIQLPEGYRLKEVKFTNQRTGKVHYVDTATNSDHIETIYLPEDVKPSVAQNGYPVDAETNSISFRLPTSPELTTPRASNIFLDNPNIRVPWSAGDLDSSCKIYCAGCSNMLIKPNNITEYKPLPSENWAEMMDFWHCHKPKDDNERNYNPAYATTKFIPSKGKCLVGLSYYLFNSSDLNQLKCPQCSRVLGQKEDDTTIRIWKWNTRIEAPREDVPEWYPYYYYVSATICELIESHAIYTFSIRSGDCELLLWIFNPHIRFTTSNCTAPSNGFKVFYSTDKTKIPELQQKRGDVEEVSIPKAVYDSLVERLTSSNEAFPSNARDLGEWKAGVLDKL